MHHHDVDYVLKETYGNCIKCYQKKKEIQNIYIINIVKNTWRKKDE